MLPRWVDLVFVLWRLRLPSNPKVRLLRRSLVVLGQQVSRNLHSSQEQYRLRMPGFLDEYHLGPNVGASTVTPAEVRHICPVGVGSE